MKSPFNSFTTLHALQNAWRAVRTKNSAGGVDGYTIAHFEKKLADNLTELQHELTAGTWNPEPYLRVELENAGAELVVSTPGSYIGASYKGITVKIQGKITNKPSAALRHITVIGKGVSFSSNAMMYCMNHKIPIDFFDSKGKQYATVLNPVFLDETLWSKQVGLPLERKVRLASQIIVGKLKNQLNLIKYYHKYHKDILGGDLSEKYVEAVLKLEQQIEKAKNYPANDAKYASGLMILA